MKHLCPTCCSQISSPIPKVRIDGPYVHYLDMALKLSPQKALLVWHILNSKKGLNTKQLAELLGGDASSNSVCAAIVTINKQADQRGWPKLILRDSISCIINPRML